MKKTKTKKISEVFVKLRKGIRSASFTTEYKTMIEYNHHKISDNLIYHKMNRKNKITKNKTICKSIYNILTKTSEEITEYEKF